MTDLTYPLSAEAAEDFERYGFLCPLDVITPSEVARLLTVIRPDGGGQLGRLARVNPHLLIPELWEIVHDPRILDRVQSLLGPDIYCIGSSTIEKAPGTEDYVAWHQDATFWGMEGVTGATAWLALTPAPLEAGCMQAIAGTHRRQLQHRDTGDSNNMLGLREEVCAPVDAEAATALALEPGQMSLHHPLVLHGSGVNRSGRDRIGFVIRYFSAAVRQKAGSVTLVRGRNLSEMPLETGPFDGTAEDRLRAHARMTALRLRAFQAEKDAHLAQQEGET